jgi:hypothetical protein
VLKFKNNFYLVLLSKLLQFFRCHRVKSVISDQNSMRLILLQLLALFKTKDCRLELLHNSLMRHELHFRDIWKTTKEEGMKVCIH